MLTALLRRGPLTLALLTSLSFVASLPAQVDRDEVIELSPFVVETQDSGYFASNSLSAYRVNTAVKDLPFNMEIFTAEFVEDLKATDLEEVLFWATGVNVAGAGQRDVGSDNFTIRGLRASRPKRNGFTRYYIMDTTNIGQVEVVKGPVSALFGTSEPGGIINYITRKPMPDVFARLRPNVGSWDYYRAQLELTGPILPSGKLLYRLDASWLDRGGYRDFNDETRTFVAPVLEFRPLDNWVVRVDYEFSESEVSPLAPVAIWNPEAYADWVARGSPIGISTSRQESYVLPRNEELGLTLFTDIADERVSLRRNSTGPDAFINTDSDALTAETTATITEWPDLRGVVADTTTTRDTYSSSPNRLRLMGDGMQRNSGVRQQLDNSTLHAQIDLLLNFEFAAIQHRFIVGGEYYEDHFKVRDINLADPSLLFFREDSLPLPEDFFYLRSPYRFMRFQDYALAPVPEFPDDTWKLDQTQETSSYYISYQATAWNERLRLLTGIRRDENIAFDNQRDIAIRARTYTDSPQIGLNLEALPGWILYANYSESFVHIGGSMRIINEDRTDTIIVARPPLLGEGHEFGVKWVSADNVWSGTLAFFDIARTNVVQSASFTPETGPNAGNALSYNRLIDGETSKGFEVDVTWNPRPHVQLKLGYANIDAQSLDEAFEGHPFEEYLRTIRGVPEHDLTFVGSYEFTEGLLEDLKLVLSANYKSQRSGGNNLSPDNLDRIWLDEYVRFDLLAKYGHAWGDADVDYSIRLENLFDTEYFMPGPHLGNPLNVRVGATVSF